MKVTPDLRGARLSVSQTAELAGMHPAHLRRLCRRGVFPRPRRSAKGRPYFDFDLLVAIAGVLKSQIGHNGEECTFYRRNRRSARQPQRPRPDPYFAALAKALSQVGVPQDRLTKAKLAHRLEAAFGADRPDLPTAIAALARELLA